MNFDRKGLSQIGILIESSEELAPLGAGAYVEDDRGRAGYLTLHHPVTGLRYSVPMAEVEGGAEGVPHDAFMGWAGLAALPNGRHLLLGRVRDRAGNAANLERQIVIYDRERVPSDLVEQDVTIQAAADWGEGQIVPEVRLAEGDAGAERVAEWEMVPAAGADVDLLALREEDVLLREIPTE